MPGAQQTDQIGNRHTGQTSGNAHSAVQIWRQALRLAEPVSLATVLLIWAAGIYAALLLQFRNAVKPPCWSLASLTTSSSVQADWMKNVAGSRSARQRWISMQPGSARVGSTIASKASLNGCSQSGFA